MTNNEAIKWLNNLISDLGNQYYESLWPYAPAIYEICELLEEQEPVALIQAEKVESHRWEIVKIYCCGNCGLEFDHYAWQYCPYCGRKAKLNE